MTRVRRAFARQQTKEPLKQAIFAEGCLDEDLIRLGQALGLDQSGVELA